MNTICTNALRRRQEGFTLIELMIVVVIIGILASIAYPSYLSYVQRGHRAAAQSEMMDIANRQQQFFLANRRYATSLPELNYTLPPDVSARYSATLNTDNGATPPVFNIQFTAIGAQASDGNLALNSAGQKTPEGKW
jgi:type IV pilus assembly protein PilE